MFDLLIKQIYEQAVPKSPYNECYFCVPRVKVIFVSKKVSRSVFQWKIIWICLTWQPTTSIKDTVEILLKTTVHFTSSQVNTCESLWVDNCWVSFLTSIKN